MSAEGKKIIRFILSQLSGCKYGYRTIVSGCFDTAINNYGFAVPTEPKDLIIDEAILLLR